MQKHVSSVMLFLLAMSTLALALEIRPARADGTIYINADGSITPSSVPISTFDNVTYTFTGNINESIVVQRNNIVINGAGCTVRGSGSGNGIDLESVNNVTIEDTSITGFSSDIWLNSSSNNTLSDNSIAGNGLYGIGLNYSSSNTLSDNTASGNGVGIYLYYSSNNTLSGNKVTGNYKGIVIDSCSNNTLHDNNAEGNPALGIGLYSSSNDTLSSNNATGNSGLGGVGIYLSSSSFNTLSGNIASANYDGIVLDSSAGSVLFQNIIDSSVRSNFGVYGSALGDYINWIDASNLADGKPVYYIVNQNGFLIDPQTHPSVGYLALVNCTRITVENLSLANIDRQSLLLAYTTNSTITQNNISNNRYGVYLFSSSNNTLSGNNVTGATQYTYTGILLDSSYNNTVSHNDVTGNGSGIELDSSSGNTVSGNNVTRNPGGIGLSSSSNNTLSGNIVAGSTSWGISLGDSSNNAISDNNVTGNSYQGIYLYSSSNNAVSYNSVTENFGDGFYFFYCSNNTVSGNNVTRNYYGIWFDDSSENTVLGNIATANSGSGIALGSSSYNKVLDNSVIGNGNGIFLDNSSNNAIYHNNFINNTQQTALSTSGKNAWDDGYPSSGNCWSNYTGTDSYSGPHQNETGNDGIGDTPYVLDANNTDYYPLMAPITSFNAGTWNGTVCKVYIESNSTVSSLQIDIANKTVSFNVTGPESAHGFCRMTVPNIIVQNSWHGNYTVLLDNERWPFTSWTDASNTYIYINYTHSEHEVMIIPESPSTMTMWLLAALSTVAAVLANRRMLRKLKI